MFSFDTRKSTKIVGESFYCFLRFGCLLLRLGVMKKTHKTDGRKEKKNKDEGKEKTCNIL